MSHGAEGTPLVKGPEQHPKWNASPIPVSMRNDSALAKHCFWSLCHGNSRAPVKNPMVKTKTARISEVWHVYTVANGFIERMDLRENEASSEPGPSEAFSKR